jgi:translation initiation factor 4B
MERGGSRRGGLPEGDGKSRDFSNWERRGPLSPVPGAEPQVRGPGRVRNLESEERRNSPSWGEGRSQEGSRTRPEVRDRPPPPERKPTAAEQDNQWRTKMRPDPPIKSKSPTPDPSTPSSPSHAPALSVRPKLNLAKRTVSEAVTSPSTESASGDAKASPFGAARPIDTAAREKEVEAKRQAAIKEKKEADEKAREEKKAKDAEAKAAAAKEAEEGSVSAEGTANGSEAADAEKITVLSRPKDGEAAEKEKTAPNGDRPIPTHPRNRGPPREPREPREPRGPREPRDPKDSNDAPRGPRNNAGPRDWRRKTSEGGRGQSNPASPVTPAATQDDDGWSTVAPKQKGKPPGRGAPAPRTTAA